LFLRNLEEDPELRSGINLYKAPEVTTAAPDAPERGAGTGKKNAQFAMDVDEVVPVELVRPVVTRDRVHTKRLSNLE
jgi:nonsense-mediated mRNA decay protein 3